jgi:hypothetical protein
MSLIGGTVSILQPLIDVPVKALDLFGHGAVRLDSKERLLPGQAASQPYRRQGDDDHQGRDGRQQ